MNLGGPLLIPVRPRSGRRRRRYGRDEYGDRRAET
jgi:hypothetical protein